MGRTRAHLSNHAGLSGAHGHRRSDGRTSRPAWSRLASLPPGAPGRGRTSGRRNPAGSGRLIRSRRAGRVRAALSPADQELVEGAMALAWGPLVLLLDEPTGGLAPEETSGVVRLLQHVASERGVTVLLIEHDMEAVFAVAQRIVVLH